MTEPENSSVRASDADREAVAERLREAQAEGRLDLMEYDERVQGAYAAVTQADLVPLTADLPASEQKKSVEPASKRGLRKIPPEVQAWANTGVILVGIWLVTFIASDGPMFFWPIFPLGIWGSVLVARFMFGGSSSCESDDSGNSDGSGGSDSSGSGSGSYS